MAGTNIILQPLTLSDADAFFGLYFPTDGEPDTNESPEVFTRRIMSLCERIFTIRTIERPDDIIGDCALHHWDTETKSVEIGGSLKPEYWGRGIMASAFGMLSEIAVKELRVASLVAKTETGNVKALAFAQKFGFVEAGVKDGQVILHKKLRQ
ncbi:GNAT family N-acetyltransferase [Mucilaginibacter myungsuensis]|uniref:GNAT family N-acetyltransferase n=1 Tax=Mucilaginibacter myungsuensis TaxID=649104 RepID=A0A929KZ35_9SPHI|nr:GNAT family N-acetyltransferase [Mucilaginibacter myungsuensis]MBE9661230.1 GNAT family N-acetyltransferase [Mucilaginibacter myungsuensis]MDN3597374.1 GNAT family N-acetyltransferase [Mucilaginibacter myungsuensis]